MGVPYVFNWCIYSVVLKHSVSWVWWHQIFLRGPQSPVFGHLVLSNLNSGTIRIVQFWYHQNCPILVPSELSNSGTIRIVQFWYHQNCPILVPSELSNSGTIRIVQFWYHQNCPILVRSGLILSYTVT